MLSSSRLTDKLCKNVVFLFFVEGFHHAIANYIIQNPNFAARKNVSMKKIILFAVIFVSTVQFIFAQKVDLGLKLHPNFGWFNSVNGTAKSDGMRFGYSYGLMGDFYLNKKNNYAIATEFSITNICGRLTAPTGSDAKATEKVRITYIDIPLTLKLKTDELGRQFPLKYYGQFGLTPGFKIGAKSKDEKGNSHSIGSDLQPVRYGLLIGAGAEYTVQGSTRVIAGLTYNNGLNNVFKGSTGFSSKISYIALNMGVFF